VGQKLAVFWFEVRLLVLAEFLFSFFFFPLFCKMKFRMLALIGVVVTVMLWGLWTNRPYLQQIRPNPPPQPSHHVGDPCTVDAFEPVDAKGVDEAFVPSGVQFFSFVRGKRKAVLPLAGSLHRLGAELRVVGWDPTPSKYKEVVMQKFEQMQRAVEGAGVNEEDVVCFMDGFDMVAQHLPPKELLKRYLNITKGKRGIVFSGEKNCFPFDDYKESGGGWRMMWDRALCVQPEDKAYYVTGKEMCQLMADKVRSKLFVFIFQNFDLGS
jgi:hypothetical protein